MIGILTGIKLTSDIPENSLHGDRQYLYQLSKHCNPCSLVRCHGFKLSLPIYLFRIDQRGDQCSLFPCLKSNLRGWNMSLSVTSSSKKHKEANTREKLAYTYSWFYNT